MLGRRRIDRPGVSAGAGLMAAVDRRRDPFGSIGSACAAQRYAGSRQRSSCPTERSVRARLLLRLVAWCWLRCLHYRNGAVRSGDRAIWYHHGDLAECRTSRRGGLCRSKCASFAADAGCCPARDGQNDGSGARSAAAAAALSPHRSRRRIDPR